MKQSDIAIIILITVVSLGIAFFLGSTFIKPPEDRTSEVEVSVEIQDNLGELDTAVFNDQAINPAETINIGNQNSNNPFDQ